VEGDPLTSEVLLPLSKDRREAALRRQADIQAGALAPLVSAQVVEQVEHLLAERFAQPLAEPIAGRVGYQELIRPDDPAAGADLVYVVGGEAVLWPLSVMAELTCSAGAGQRSLTLEYRDGDGVRYLVAGANVTLGPSQTQAFCWQPEAGSGFWPVDDAAIAPLPQQHLYGGHQLAIHLSGADPADQLSLVRLSALLYPTGPRGL